MPTPYETFLADSSRRDVYLWTLTPRDAAGASVTVRLGTEEWLTSPADTPAGAFWRGGLLEPLGLDAGRLPVRGSGISSRQANGELRVGHLDGALDFYDDYAWDGASATCLHGGHSVILGRRLMVSEMREIWQGRVERCLVGLDDVRISLAPRDVAFRGEFEKRRHRGNTWRLDFSGSTSISFASSPTALDLRGNLTVHAVIYPDSAGAGTTRHIAGWNVGATTYPWQLFVNTSNQLQFRDSTPVINQSSTATLSTERSYWVAVTINGTQLRFLILDLQTMVETVETYTVSSSARPAPDGTFRIGRSTSGFDGMMDSFYVYSAALSLEQLRQRRLRPLSSTELADSTLEIAMLMDDGTGASSAADAGPNGYTGTVNSGTYYPSLEGGAELAGRPKLNILGHPENFSPRLVATSPNHVYQWHAGATKAAGSITVYEGMIAGTLGTSYTNLKTFLAATTTAGQVDVLRHATGSFIRFGTNPTLPVTMSAEGDADDGTYRSTVADLVKYIAMNRGEDPLASGEINAGSFTDLAAGAPGVVGLAVDGETTVEAVVLELTTSISAHLWMSRAGELFIQQLAIPKSPVDWTLTAREIVDVRRIAPEQVAARVTVLFRRNYTHLDTDSIGAAATLAVRAFAMGDWQRATVRDRTVAAAHPRAEERVIETALRNRADAQAEAARIFGFDSVDGRIWEVDSAVVNQDVEPLDSLELSLAVPGADGVPAERFGWPLGFVVLGWAISAGRDKQTYLCWRPA